MSGPWEKYGASPAPEEQGPWARYAAPVPAQAGTRPPVLSFKQLPKKVDAIDRVRAAAAGVNKGFFSDLVGLPVDTMASAIDLAKAGVGFAYNEGKQLATGKQSAPPAWTEPADRSKVVMSSEWIADKLNAGGLGAAINNPNPQDTASRILHTGGRFAGASVVPSAAVSGKGQLANAGIGAISGLVSGSVGEVAPEWAGVAGMAPVAGVIAGQAATRRMIRGGEAGRQKMVKRMEDLKAGGIDSPSVGLASGNPTVMGLENLLAQTPFSAGLYEKAGQANISGMKGKTDRLRDSISPEFGPVVAGGAIQSALKDGFRGRVNATSRVLNDKVADNVGPGSYTFPQNALDVSRSMSAVNPAAPATSAALRNGRISGIADDLARDVQGTPIPGNPLMNSRTRYQRADGEIMDTPPGIPFPTLKNLRTSIGEEAGSSAIIGTPEGAQFKRLYGAMSQDMRQAVATADRQRAGVSVGPLSLPQLPASRALDRANKFYSRAATRAEDLNAIANRSTPEGAYGAVANSLNSGPTTYSKLRGAVDPATRQKLAATIIDDMGMAKPGQQGADGDVWSPRTFLTNYSKLNQNGGGKELFKRLPGGEKHAQELASIAKTTEMLGDASKVWANPSGTAAAMSARGALYTMTAGAFFNPLVAARTAAGLGVSHQVSRRMLLNPKFTRWLVQAESINPSQVRAHAQRLVATANISRDEQFKQDTAEYLRMVEDGPEEVDEAD
jgi:hypothetical protein